MREVEMIEPCELRNCPLTLKAAAQRNENGVLLLPLTLR
jgi:hypothetical protein